LREILPHFIDHDHRLHYQRRCLRLADARTLLILAVRFGASRVLRGCILRFDSGCASRTGSGCVLRTGWSCVLRTASASLLLKDMIAWSQGLTPAQRQQLLALDPARLPPHFLTPTGGDAAGLGVAEIEAIKRRALRRAEQLSNIYLKDADSADDQSSMDLAQELAAQSIMRLASLRHLASEPGLR
jgi:hypothetical protein